jgi:hypothetical protein
MAGAVPARSAGAAIRGTKIANHDPDGRATGRNPPATFGKGFEMTDLSDI